MDFPDDSILIARGKISTLNSVRRDLLKQMQAVSNRILGVNTRLLGYANNSKMDEALPGIEEIIGAGHELERLHAALAVVLTDMELLRPEAWGNS